MVYELALPDIGEGLTEAEIVRWHVAVGETEGLNEPLVEVETDKAVVEIPSPQAGVVLHQGGAEGDTVKVGALLAAIGAVGETWGEVKAVETPAAVTAPPAAVASTARVLAMPLVRRLARELGVDLATVSGSGPGGKITRADVQNAAAAEVPQHAATAEAVVAATTPPAVTEFEGETLSAMRRTIARNLTQSWTEIPHVTVWRPADATRILAAKKETGAPLEALLIKAVLPVLAEFRRSTRYLTARR